MQKWYEKPYVHGTIGAVELETLKSCTVQTEEREKVKIHTVKASIFKFSII